MKKILNKKSTGMSLIEILVAIAVSGIIMISAAGFGMQLMYASEDNFMEDTSNQALSIYQEQLRLLEIDLQNGKTNGGDYTLLTSGQKNSICTATSTAPFYFYFKFPAFNQTPATPSPTPIPYVMEVFEPSASVDTENVGGLDYKFVKLESTNLFGAFAQSDSREVYMSTRVESQNLTNIGEVLVFNTVIKYKVLNSDTYRYSSPLKIIMIKSLIC